MMDRRQWIAMSLGALAGAAVSRSAFADSNSDLDVALQAARWIRTSRIETRNGVAWPADPRKPDVSYPLYSGIAGVILFHLELYHATRDRQWLEEAKLGARELIAHLPAMDAGLYEGLGGAVFVLEETHRATGDGMFRDAARKALRLLHAQATKEPAYDIVSGKSGIGLTLLWAHKRMHDPASRALAVQLGKQLLSVAIPDHGGLKWELSPTVAKRYPNFSHGTAGVAFFLATLRHREFLAGAQAGVKYLRAIANTDGGGFKVFHHEPGGEDLYYLSWCHGPAGTARLFERLEQISEHEKWSELTERAARATIDAGVPETQSPGYWNNVSQCCGNAGVGEFFIDLQRNSPRPAYASMIERVKANTLARATAEGGGLKWIQAENRVSPEDVVAQTGYMQGAAGIGAFFLHAHAPRAILWPDSAELI